MWSNFLARYFILNKFSLKAIAICNNTFVGLCEAVIRNHRKG